MKDIKVVVKKMTRNCRKMIGKKADSLLCPLHNIQFSPQVFLPLLSEHVKRANEMLLKVYSIAFHFLSIAIAVTTKTIVVQCIHVKKEILVTH